VATTAKTVPPAADAAITAGTHVRWAIDGASASGSCPETTVAKVANANHRNVRCCQMTRAPVAAPARGGRVRPAATGNRARTAAATRNDTASETSAGRAPAARQTVAPVATPNTCAAWLTAVARPNSGNRAARSTDSAITAASTLRNAARNAPSRLAATIAVPAPGATDGTVTTAAPATVNHTRAVRRGGRSSQPPTNAATARAGSDRAASTSAAPAAEPVAP
jgi:hypothetical protein